MARKVGSIYAEVIAKLDRLEKGLNQGQQMAQRSAAKMQSTFDKINFDQATNSFSKFQRLLIAGVAGVGVKNIAAGFIETAASFEMMRTKLEAIEGARGLRLFEDLNKMALELPVSTQKVVQSFVTMQAMGLEPTRRQMLILADTAAVLGDDVFDRIVLQLGQMSAKGKIMAQDLNILAEAGINARGILKDTFGMTVEQLQESKIGIDKVIEALFEGMNKKFAGSSEKIMNTWRGVTELMKSNWIEIERTIADAGVFDLIKKQVKDVSDALKVWLENNKEIIKQDVPRYVTKVSEALETVKAQFEKLWKILTYDPDIIQYGLIGLLIGGKKGAIVAGGAAHLIKIPGMLAEASALAAKGYVKISDVVMSDYKELEKIIEQGRKLESGWKPGPLALVPSHGGALQQTHGNFKNTTKQIEEYSDGWRRRWEDDWKNWGFRLDGKYFIAPETAEDVEKKLSKIASAEKKALENHKKMIEDYADIAMTQFPADYWSIEADRAKSFTDSIKNAQQAAENFEKNNMELWKKPYFDENAFKDPFDELVNLSERTAEAMQQNFSDLFFDAFTGKLKSLEDYAEAVFTSIQRAAADMAGQMLTQQLFGPEFKGGGLLSSLMAMLGGSATTGMGTNTQFAGGSSIFDFFAMVKHGGGIVGKSGGAMRAVPKSAFSFASRYHDGLMPDEMPAILQKGERVIPRGSAEVGSPINIYIQAPKGRIDRDSISEMQASLYSSMVRSARRNT